MFSGRVRDSEAGKEPLVECALCLLDPEVLLLLEAVFVATVDLTAALFPLRLWGLQNVTVKGPCGKFMQCYWQQDKPYFIGPAAHWASELVSVSKLAGDEVLERTQQKVKLHFYKVWPAFNYWKLTSGSTGTVYRSIAMKECPLAVQPTAILEFGDWDSKMTIKAHYSASKFTWVFIFISRKWIAIALTTRFRGL